GLADQRLPAPASEPLRRAAAGGAPPPQRLLSRDVHVGGEDGSGGAGGRVLLGPGCGGGGGAAGVGGARVVAADVPQPVRGVPPVPAGARGHPARPELPARVLPGGLALQVRQQAIHAL
ncbi:unnamed protein product, partial [Urochloa humidicola]